MKQRVMTMSKFDKLVIGGLCAVIICMFAFGILITRLGAAY